MLREALGRGSPRQECPGLQLCGHMPTGLGAVGVCEWRSRWGGLVGSTRRRGWGPGRCGRRSPGEKVREGQPAEGVLHGDQQRPRRYDEGGETARTALPWPRSEQKSWSCDFMRLVHFLPLCEPAFPRCLEGAFRAPLWVVPRAGLGPGRERSWEWLIPTRRVTDQGRSSMRQS